MNPDELEVAPGFAKENLQGLVWDTASEEALRAGLEKAFDYRGDVTITRKDGTKVEGYIFDRRNGATLRESVVRLIPNESAASTQVSLKEGRTEGTIARQKVSIPYSDIAALAFTGRDTAAGRSWEAWVRKYWEKKAAGEKQIALEPEKLE